jgi:hypothetical protein
MGKTTIDSVANPCARQAGNQTALNGALRQPTDGQRSLRRQAAGTSLGPSQSEDRTLRGEPCWETTEVEDPRVIHC